MDSRKSSDEDKASTGATSSQEERVYDVDLDNQPTDDDLASQFERKTITKKRFIEED